MLYGRYIPGIWGYDIAVAEQSARGDFLVGATTGYEGLYDIVKLNPWDIGDSIRRKYDHGAILQQPDVSLKVSALLEGGEGSFMKFPQNALRSKLTNADNAKTAAAKMLQSDTLADMTETCFVIDASSASIKAPDSIKFNVTSSRPINGDVILVLEASDGDRWFKLPKTDDDNNKYELTVNFSNEVTGIMNAFCFAHDGKIYVSDKTRLVVTPDLSGLRNVKFADDSGILLVSAGEEKSFTLLAETEDGEIYVISSPQMGTSYSIDDSSVVKVTAEGRLLGLKEGETTLTAANGGFSAKVTVIVDPGTAQSTDPVDPINPVDPADPGSSGSGGGGCSALGIGFGVMALAAGILLKKRGKR